MASRLISIERLKKKVFPGRLYFIADVCHILLLIFTLIDLTIHGNIHVGSGEEVDKIRMIKSQKLTAGSANAAGLEFAFGQTVQRHAKIKGSGEFSHAIDAMKQISLAHPITGNCLLQELKGAILPLDFSKHCQL